MDARERERLMLDRCGAVALRADGAASNAQEANVFRIAASVLRSTFPAESSRLERASSDYFAKHPRDLLGADEVVRTGLVVGLPRLRDMLSQKIRGRRSMHLLGNGVMFHPTLLNAHLSSEFVGALTAALIETRAGLVLVNATCLDFRLTVVGEYLSYVYEQMRVAGRDVKKFDQDVPEDVLQSQQVEARAGSVIFVGEIRCRAGVARACDYVDSGAIVVATIHGQSPDAAIERLNFLAGEDVRQSVSVIPYSARHEFCATC